MANIQLTWTDNSANEDGFHVYRSLDGAEANRLADVGPDMEVFNDLDVKPGTYIYSVSAFNFAGESARVASNTVIVLDTPAAPSNVVASLTA